jgi:ribosomal protein S18 acetylase RimI-like enzyme
MNATKTQEIVDDSVSRTGDQELEALLRHVYVDGGFTEPDVARAMFTAEAVRARGRLLCARDAAGALIGTVIVVPPESAARRLAAPTEAEMHLLAVDGRCRGQGVGRALVHAAVESAQQAGYRGMVLWTQPTMLAAHRLYEELEFSRSPAEDFERGGRAFRVYRRRF